MDLNVDLNMDLNVDLNVDFSAVSPINLSLYKLVISGTHYYYVGKLTSELSGRKPVSSQCFTEQTEE